jgi:hypothetical protein
MKKLRAPLPAHPAKLTSLSQSAAHYSQNENCWNLRDRMILSGMILSYPWKGGSDVPLPRTEPAMARQKTVKPNRSMKMKTILNLCCLASAAVLWPLSASAQQAIVADLGADYRTDTPKAG